MDPRPLGQFSHPRPFPHLDHLFETLTRIMTRALMRSWVSHNEGSLRHLSPPLLIVLGTLQQSLLAPIAILLLALLSLIATRFRQRGANSHLRLSLRSSRGPVALDLTKATASERGPNRFAADLLSHLEGVPLFLPHALRLSHSAHRQYPCNLPALTHRSRDRPMSMDPPRARRHHPRVW